MKIPKLRWVSLDQSRGKIPIDVLVEQNDDGSQTPKTSQQ
jgi:hypothetical protein